jgi:hypothetical protein
VKNRLFLKVVIGEGAAILKLLAFKDESQLVRWNTFLVIYLHLDVVDGVVRLGFKGDGLASEGFAKDLHAVVEIKDEVGVVVTASLITWKFSFGVPILAKMMAKMVNGKNGGEQE